MAALSRRGSSSAILDDSCVALPDNVCYSCQRNVAERDFAVSCIICNCPAHAACANISGDQYRRFDKAGALPFITPICSPCLSNCQHLSGIPSAPDRLIGPPCPPDFNSLLKTVMDAVVPKIGEIVREVVQSTGTSTLPLSQVSNDHGAPEDAPSQLTTYASMASAPTSGPAATSVITPATRNQPVRVPVVMPKFGGPGTRPQLPGGQGQRPKKRLTAGTATDGPLCGVVVQKAVFHVRNLDVTKTTEQGITDHLTANNITVTNVSLLPNKFRPSAVNARVTVHQPDGRKVFNPSLWPTGAFVRSWTHKPKPPASQNGDDRQTTGATPDDAESPVGTGEQTD